MATEFLVLIASLLELKSRLMLPGAEDELEELAPEEAVEELLARMLEYRRYRDAAGDAGASASRPSAATSTARRRCRRELRRVAARRGDRGLRPRAARRRARRPADRRRPSSTSATSARPSRWSGGCGPCATRSRGRASFDFDEQFGGEDRLTQAVTLFALLELYRKGEATWEQAQAASARSRSASEEAGAA